MFPNLSTLHCVLYQVILLTVSELRQFQRAACLRASLTGSLGISTTLSSVRHGPSAQPRQTHCIHRQATWGRRTTDAEQRALQKWISQFAINHRERRRPAQRQGKRQRQRQRQRDSFVASTSALSMLLSYFWPLPVLSAEFPIFSPSRSVLWTSPEQPRPTICETRYL